MNAPLTARELFEDIRSARQFVAAAVENYQDANARLVRAAIAYEQAEAKAFIAANAQGMNNEVAKRIAATETFTEKQAMEKAKADKQTANLESSAWQKIVDAYAATSYALNRELRLEETGQVAS